MPAGRQLGCGSGAAGA